MLSRVATKQKYAFRTKCKLKKHLKNGWWKKLRRKNHICQRWRSSQLIMISFSLLLLLTQISQLHWDQILIFSCPQQLNRWPCHWLTHFYFWQVTSDKWQFLRFFDNFQQFSTILTIWDNFDNFWQFLIVWTIFESFDNFWEFWQFLTIFTIWQCWNFLTIFNNHDNFWQFLQFFFTIMTIFYNFYNFLNILKI